MSTTDKYDHYADRARPLLEVPPLTTAMTCLTGQSCHNIGDVCDDPAGHTIMTHLAPAYYRHIIALTLLFHHPASLAHVSRSTFLESAGPICCPTVPRCHNHLPLPLDGHQSVACHGVDPSACSRPRA